MELDFNLLKQEDLDEDGIYDELDNNESIISIVYNIFEPFNAVYGFYTAYLSNKRLWSLVKYYLR